MRQAILVNAYNRPRHLYVCLTSISRCHHLADWDVWVDYDGGQHGDFSVCADVLNHFSIVRRDHFGCRYHYTEGFKTLLTHGYERILMADDDHLFRRDLLDAVLSISHPGCLASAFHWPDNALSMIRWTSDAPVLFTADQARDIVQFMDSRSDVGLPDVCQPGHTIPIACNYRDASWTQWCLKRSLVTNFSSEQLSLNFGFGGEHRHDTSFDAIVFSGLKETWFDVVIATANSSQFASMLTTPGFTYV
jgi:hypothetical protein